MPNYESAEFNPPAPMAQVLLRNLESGAVWTDVPMLIDTGADATMIPQSALGLLGLTPITGRQHKLQSFNDSESYSLVVRVEHIFGFMTNSMKEGLNMRWIGMPRITAGIGLLNLVYNLARYEQILRLRLA